MPIHYFVIPGVGPGFLSKMEKKYHALSPHRYPEFISGSPKKRT